MKKIYTTLCIFAALVFTGCNKQNAYKDFILENADKIQKNEYGTFQIDSAMMPKGYYTDISIRLQSDSSYDVVVWGDRKSWLWDFRKDFSFSADVPHKRSAGKDVEKDVKIIEILKTKK